MPIESLINNLVEDTSRPERGDPLLMRSNWPGVDSVLTMVSGDSKYLLSRRWIYKRTMSYVSRYDAF